MENHPNAQRSSRRFTIFQYRSKKEDTGNKTTLNKTSSSSKEKKASKTKSFQNEIDKAMRSILKPSDNTGFFHKKRNSRKTFQTKNQPLPEIYRRNMRKFVFSKRYLGKKGEELINEKIKNFSREIEKLNLTKENPLSPSFIQTINNSESGVPSIRRPIFKSHRKSSVGGIKDFFITYNSPQKKVLTSEGVADILGMINDWIESNKIIFKRAFYHRDLVKCINSKLNLI